MEDWRKDYIVCAHIMEDSEAESFHQGFRACCKKCCDRGFFDKHMNNTYVDTLKDGQCVAYFRSDKVNLVEQGA